MKTQSTVLRRRRAAIAGKERRCLRDKNTLLIADTLKKVLPQSTNYLGNLFHVPDVYTRSNQRDPHGKQ